MKMPTHDSRPVDKDYVVAGQISVDDVAAIAAEGFKTIICNRPDGEAQDQTDHLGIKAVAEAHGLSFHFIPVSPAGMTPENVEATKSALASSPKPIFAYCRSGARSTGLYNIARG